MMILRMRHGVSRRVPELNVILVTGASARARTITLEARHWIVGSFAAIALLIVFTVLTLLYGAIAVFIR